MTTETNIKATKLTKLEEQAVSLYKVGIACATTKDKAHGQAEGVATIAHRMFTEGATQAELTKAFETAEALVRSGQVKGAKLKEAAKRNKDGTVKYLVPGVISNAKSVTTRAAQYKVPRTVESYGAMRTAVKIAADKETAKNASEQETAYMALLDAIKVLAETAKEPETKKLPTDALVTSGQAVRAAIDWIMKQTQANQTVTVTTTAAGEAAAKELAKAA